jgi:hypothetical protein
MQIQSILLIGCRIYITSLFTSDVSDTNIEFRHYFYIEKVGVKRLCLQNGKL